jgi:hypothetical protein
VRWHLAASWQQLQLWCSPRYILILAQACNMRLRGAQLLAVFVSYVCRGSMHDHSEPCSTHGDVLDETKHSMHSDDAAACAVLCCRAISSTSHHSGPPSTQGDVLDASKHAGKPGWLLAASVTSPALGQVSDERIDYGATLSSSRSVQWGCSISGSNSGRSAAKYAAALQICMSCRTVR